MKKYLLIVGLISLLSACGRDGHLSTSYYGGIDNQGAHVSYGSTDVRLFEMHSPSGHDCTVAATDNNHGGVAMHCWN